MVSGPGNALLSVPLIAVKAISAIAKPPESKIDGCAAEPWARSGARVYFLFRKSAIG